MLNQFEPAGQGCYSRRSWVSPSCCPPWSGWSGPVILDMRVKGKRPLSHLLASLSEIEGVSSVGCIEDDLEIE